MGQIPGLVPLAQTKLIGLMAGYAVHPEHAARFVVTPELGDDAGIAGGFVLAESALP